MSRSVIKSELDFYQPGSFFENAGAIKVEKLSPNICIDELRAPLPIKREYSSEDEEETVPSRSKEESSLQFSLNRLKVKKISRRNICPDSSSSSLVKSRLSLISETKTKPTVPLSSCQICGKSYRSYYIKQHEAIHSADPSFHCSICDKKFLSALSLKNHSYQHSSELAFTCTLCQRKFTSPNKLYHHRLTHKANGILNCDICNEGFNDGGDLEIHKQCHNSNEKFECSICHKLFSYWMTYQRHLTNHRKEKVLMHQCEFCERHFSTKCDLDIHTRTHFGQERYRCETCGKRFSYSGHLSRHALTHLHEKFYKCDKCEKEYRLAHHLKRHHLSKHN